MKKKILTLIAAIPALLVGIGQNLPDSRDISTFDLNVIMLPQKIVLVRHDTSQSPPLILAARDGKEEDCHWKGTCNDRD